MLVAWLSLSGAASLTAWGCGGIATEEPDAGTRDATRGDVESRGPDASPRSDGSDDTRRGVEGSMLDHEVGTDAGGALDAGTDAALEADTAPEADGALEVVRPRPIAPLSTSRVTSQSPTLRWALPAGSDGAQVDLCSDRACSSIVTSFSVTGSQGAPPSPLSPGIYYWRTFGTMGGTVNTVASFVWQFWVGARSAAVDTSYGTVLDLNGDGFADLAVGGPEGTTSGTVTVFLGGPTGLSTVPVVNLQDPGASSFDWFGASVASAGDVNGDGYGDLIVCAIFAPWVPIPSMAGNGIAYLYAGGKAGPAATPATQLGPPTAFVGTTVTSAGDVNGDGYADVLFGSQVYLGGPKGLGTTPAWTASVPGFASAFASAVGDFNGDGFSDVVLTGATPYFPTIAYVFLGSSTGLPAAPTVTLNDPSGVTGDLFGQSVATGDVNADGYADFVVAGGTSPYCGYSLDGGDDAGCDGFLYLYLGSATGPAAVPSATLTAPPMAVIGLSVASAGDLDGDGYSDLVVGGGKFGTMMTFLYRGSAAGLPAGAPIPVDMPDAGLFKGGYGVSVANAGDFNGDGFADLVLGATGSVALYSGGTPFAAKASGTLTYASAAGDFGYAVTSGQ